MILPLLNRLLVTPRHFLPAVLLLGALSLVTAPSVKAQITLTFVFDGTDTTVAHHVGAGALNSLTVNPDSSGDFFFLQAGGGYFSYGPGGEDERMSVPFTQSAWGSSSVASSNYGDGFGMSTSGQVWAPENFDYVSGTIDGGMAWVSTTPMDMGFASNASASGSFTAIGQTVTWSLTNTSAVPEPNTFAGLAGLAVMGFAVTRRRRNRTAA